MINGWEFFILNPFEINKEDVQDKYLIKYNEAYKSFISDICIPNPFEILIGTKNFLHYISCNGDLDIINKEDDYEFKFLKSVFFEKKLNVIKRDLRYYYNNFSINVTRIYKGENGYIIELNIKQ